MAMSNGSRSTRSVSDPKDTAQTQSEHASIEDEEAALNGLVEAVRANARHRSHILALDSLGCPRQRSRQSVVQGPVQAGEPSHEAATVRW